MLKMFLYRLKYLYGQHLNLKAPVDVSLELSSVCNMRCAYCYHSEPKTLPFKRGHMALDTAKLIINEAAWLGVSSLKFNWKGEGTLNPHYYQIAKIAHQEGCFIERIVNSNFLISPERRDEVFAGLALMTKVKVSYDSFDPKVFGNQRVGGNHALTTENIDLFHAHPDRIKNKTKLVIQAVRTTKNADEDIVGKAKARWPGVEVSVRDMVTGRLAGDISGLEGRKRDARGRRSCVQAHSRIIFNHSGDAFPCCPDVKEQLKLGNIWSKSLKEIFNSSEAQRLRASLVNGKAFELDPCKSCSSFESYSGYKRNWKS